MERLEHKIFRKSTFTNITGSIKFFLYTYFVSGFLDLLNLKQILILFGTNSILTVISQFFISPRAVKKITWKLSEGLQKLEQENFTEKENTELLIELNKIPKIITTGVAGNVSVVTVLVAGLAFWFSNPSIHVIVVAVTCCVLCIYSFAAKTYNETETIICKECNKIFCSGKIDDKIVKNEKFFGASIKKKILLYSIVPFFLTSLSVILNIMRMQNEYSVSERSAFTYLLQLAITIAINSFFVIKISYYAQKEINEISENFNQALEESKKVNKADLYIPTTLSNEFSYNIYLTNQLSSYLQGIVTATNNLGKEIYKTTEELYKIATRTATAAISESSAVRECFSTLEDLKKQHERLSAYIEKIQKHTDTAKEYVTDGTDLISTLKNKMSEITQANIETIKGIKTLSEKIEKIFELVNSIDEIAEKTTTIAYNAELGISMAGETGEKFHIISNEIRRLASATSNSTNEIKNRIKKIQNASDNLIISGESGAQNTTEENHIFSELESKFKDLYLSSDITVESIQSIYQITEVQKESFENINQLLSLLNSSFEKFSSCTKEISGQAGNLKIISENMGGVK